jgi:alpha-galactosidase
VAVHKSLRDLLHTGDVVRADPTDPAVWVEGVVAADRSAAAYRVAMVEHPLTDPPGRIALPGLDPDRTYRVELVAPSDGAVSPADAPAWVKGIELGGRVLEEIGLVCPRLAVDTLVLLRVTAVRRSAGRGGAPALQDAR